MFCLQTPPPLPGPGVGSKGQNSNLWEHGHDTYQIQGNQECSNMVANILPVDPLPRPWGSKGQNSTFSEHGYVAYQIKGNYECTPPSPQPLGWGKTGQNSALSEHGHAYQIKWNHKCSNMVANVLPADPPPTPRSWGGVKRSKFKSLRTWSWYVSNSRESRMQQHGSKYFACWPPSSTLGVKRLKFYFFRTWLCCTSN